MHVAEICSILKNWKTSSLDTYKFSTNNLNVASSTSIRMLWSLGIGTINLNKAIKGKRMSKDVSILWGAYCIPSLTLEEEEGITFSYGCEATFFSFVPASCFFSLHQWTLKTSKWLFKICHLELWYYSNMIFNLAVDKNTICLGHGTIVSTTSLIYTNSSPIGISR